MPKRLIINADDFGVSEEINDGIMACHQKGVLTGVSILAVGGSFAHAVDLARENGINKIGVHLALTGSFRPVSRPEAIHTLLSREGRFQKSFPRLFIKILAGGVIPNQIDTELRKQVKTVRKAGFEITHLDSHEHIHMFPPLLGPIIRLAKESEISYIRFPFERRGMKDMVRDPVNAFRYLALASICRLKKKTFIKAGLKYNDYFVGHFDAHRLNKKKLFSALQTLSEGVTELGCHPGYFGGTMAKNRPWYKHCEEELRGLCDPEFRQQIKKQGIALVAHHEQG